MISFCNKGWTFGGSLSIVRPVTELAISKIIVLFVWVVEYMEGSFRKNPIQFFSGKKQWEAEGQRKASVRKSTSPCISKYSSPQSSPTQNSRRISPIVTPSTSYFPIKLGSPPMGILLIPSLLPLLNLFLIRKSLPLYISNTIFTMLRLRPTSLSFPPPHPPLSEHPTYQKGKNPVTQNIVTMTFCSQCESITTHTVLLCKY